MEERRRVRRACRPCKVRKRRCDGQEPCEVCTRLDSDCFYETKRHRRRAKIELALARSHAQPSVPQGPSPETSEANTSNALPSRLQERLNPPIRTKGISAWNLGVSQVPTNLGARGSVDLRELVNLREIFELSNSFFRTWNRVWGFMDQAKFDEYVRRRMFSTEHDPVDPLIMGVGLIGSYFANGGPNAFQGRLYEALDYQLSRATTAEEPSIEVGAALVLKTKYLRVTGTAYATWRTSCEAVHALQTISETELGPEFIIRERLFWSTQMIHYGIATETGRPFVQLLSPTKSGSYKFNDWPMFKLYQAYSRLHTDEEDNNDEIEASMLALAAMHFEDDAVRLSQANLVFSFFRRLRLQTENVSITTMIRVLDVGTMAMASVRRLVDQRLPWWNLVHVPFQFLCTALVIDCVNALGRVRDALDALEIVAATFPSDSTVSALDLSRRMANLMKKRKLEEFNVLDRTLGAPENVSHTVSNGDANDQMANGTEAEDPFDPTHFRDLDWFSFNESVLPLLDFDTSIGT